MTDTMPDETPATVAAQRAQAFSVTFLVDLHKPNVHGVVHDAAREVEAAAKWVLHAFGEPLESIQQPADIAARLTAHGAPTALTATLDELRAVYVDMIHGSADLDWDGAVEYAEAAGKWLNQFAAWAANTAS